MMLRRKRFRKQYAHSFPRTPPRRYIILRHTVGTTLTVEAHQFGGVLRNEPSILQITLDPGTRSTLIVMPSNPPKINLLDFSLSANSKVALIGVRFVNKSTM